MNRKTILPAFGAVPSSSGTLACSSANIQVGINCSSVVLSWVQAICYDKAFLQSIVEAELQYVQQMWM